MTKNHALALGFCLLACLFRAQGVVFDKRRKKMRWHIEVKPTDIIPRGYGMAYPNPAKYTYILYPIPLNWIVRIARIVYYFLMRGFITSSEKELLKMRHQIEHDAFERGRQLEQQKFEERWKMIEWHLEENLKETRRKTGLK